MTLAFVVPPFEAPDEGSHLSYASFLATRHELPNQLDPARRAVGQGHQAPLPYVVMAVVLRAVGGPDAVAVRPPKNPAHAWHGGDAGTHVPLYVHAEPLFVATRDRIAFYAVRLLSVVYGLLTLIVLRRFVARVTSDEPTRVLAVLLAATLPQFVFVTSYATADALLILLAALTALQLARVWDAPERLGPYAALGLALGCAVLAKKTALFLVPGVAVTLAGMAAAGRVPLGAGLRGGALTALVTAAVAGWMFVRNHVLYGDPLGSQMERTTLAWLIDERSLADPYFRSDFPRLLGASFVGLLGWMNVWLPRWVYWVYAGIGVVACGGVLTRRRDPWTLVAATFAGICLAGIVVFNMTFAQPQGRYLFAALPFVALLAATGLRVTLRWPWPSIAVLAVALAAVDVTTVLRVRTFFS